MPQIAWFPCISALKSLNNFLNILSKRKMLMTSCWGQPQQKPRLKRRLRGCKATYIALAPRQPSPWPFPSLFAVDDVRTKYCNATAYPNIRPIVGCSQQRLFMWCFVAILRACKGIVRCASCKYIMPCVPQCKNHTPSYVLQLALFSVKTGRVNCDTPKGGLGLILPWDLRLSNSNNGSFP